MSLFGEVMVSVIVIENSFEHVSEFLVVTNI